ncbi:amidase [Microthyrium microscopicum]|uniref:amidase n=1 Tax=Microthyrium microscopicum TaxID=703497 RepID=A0A6A6UQM1_9PEZI|nr:amidase [Microthyrium microscopicum]
MAKWEEIAASKRASLLKSIPQEWRIPDHIKPADDVLDVSSFQKTSGWFTENELEITGQTVEQLLNKLASGALSSLDVTKAFCKAASAAHQLTNCLSETMFESALKDAQELDEHYKQTGKLKGPFHGLPISLKDNFHYEGKDSTLGFVSLANTPALTNSPLVDLLKAAGAVLYVKTNVPTAMMIAESVNNLFGRTVNPLNRKLTSGGSSGGESALIAFRGSPTGVGSDIGGSLRIPAAMTGLVTLRPSYGRFPTIGTQSGLAGQEAVQSVNGPLAHTLQDVELYCKGVVGCKPWNLDPGMIPLEWRKVTSPKKLKIGVLWDDGVVTPTPPITRALHETVKKLKAAGHEVVDWAPTGHGELVTILGKLFLADGGRSVEKLLAPVEEPIRPEMMAYKDASELGVHDMWQLQLERTLWRAKYLDRLVKAGLDAILAPTTPYAAVEHDYFKYVGYTGVWNVLDYSAVSFPTGLTADHELDANYSSDQSLGKECAEIRELYNAKNIHGMPISLQLIARRLEEEKVLAMTKTVLDAL